MRDGRQQASPISERLLQAEGTACAEAQRWERRWRMLRLAGQPVRLEWSVSEARCSAERERAVEAGQTGVSVIGRTLAFTLSGAIAGF